MDFIVLFDPSIRSLNLGDHVIMESAERHLSDITRGRYVVKCATHAPAVTFYQNTRRNPRMRFYDEAKYKFICGSNLLWRRMLVPRPTFNVNLFNCMPYEGSVLVGVGTDSGDRGVDIYTRLLYRKILSRDYSHSTRDERTKRLVESLGYNAINTGCPTMWGFTEEFCRSIPADKADNVIFTLTDYNRDYERDKEMVRILKHGYSQVYMWLQGAFDEEYLNELGENDGVTLVNPSLDAYRGFLDSMESVEYVGTRLHAGMFALQRRRKATIIAIDERVRSMRETYGINCVEREDMATLDQMLSVSKITKMSIDEREIQRWLGQFETGPVSP